MALIGYQDWQRVNFAAGNVIGSWKAAVTVATNVIQGNVIAWPYLQCFFQTVAGSDSYQITIGWYSDSAFSNQVASNSWVIGPQKVLQMAVPTQAPFMLMQILPKAGANNAVVTATVYGTSVVSSTFQSATLVSPLIQDETAYAINQQKIFAPLNLYYGKGRVAFSSSANNPYSCALQYYSFALGGFLTLERWGDISGNQNVRQDVFLPAAPIQVVVTNGATAQSIFSFVFAMPGS